MKIHREGFTSLFFTILFLVAIVVLLNIIWAQQTIYHYLIYGLLGFLFVIMLQFFRSPRRVVQQNENNIICPADGKVVVIEKTFEGEYLKEPRLQVSVFMSPLNVHVNRYPVSGEIEYYKYHPGKYLVAWHPKSSTENERTTIVIKNLNQTTILVRQIAGALARRIVCYGKTGDKVEQGAELGFIKFGSRVDLFLPLDTKLKVKIGDKVKGGKTVIATYN